MYLLTITNACFVQILLNLWFGSFEVIVKLISYFNTFKLLIEPLWNNGNSFSSASI